MSKLIKKLDTQMGITNNIVLDFKFKFETNQQNYDIFLLYLRKVHYFDYYTCTQFEN